MTNTGKSTLLSQITNAKPMISEVKFTTKLPEKGMMDWNNINFYNVKKMKTLVEGNQVVYS